jgi:K+-sensing histidine kinase KdpD
MTEAPKDFEHECNALRMKVFSRVAHDVKTPLACIIGSLGTLEQMNDSLSPEQRESLIKIALTQAHQLDAFFLTLLDAAKPE